MSHSVRTTLCDICMAGIVNIETCKPVADLLMARSEQRPLRR